MLEHKIKYKYMRRELEEELKNECFLSQMKSKRLKDMEDFFDNDDWCYEKDENENMIFYIDYDIYTFNRICKLYFNNIVISICETRMNYYFFY